METSLNLSLWDELGEDHQDDPTTLTKKIDYLQTLTGGPVGYRLRRIILCNFWLYGLKEFEIPHGRLFLAGENASGKSSVLAAALPLALDGNINPNRIDTFGTRQRKIDYYVLGSPESSTAYFFERRTTYIALEFEWCNPDQPPFAPDIRQNWLEARTPEERERARWITIGVSLAGNNNTNEKIRPLRFLITDGSRFGYDLKMTDQKNVAYDHPNFKRLLNENGRGIICDTVADYQAHVARYLFNISDVRDFQNIVNMMLVIRQPNLGTEINFNRVHDYLKQALPRIPDEITQRVTGTFERIDNIKNQLEHLQEAFDAATTLDKAAQKLALATTRRAALAYLKAGQSENTFQRRVTNFERDQAKANLELEGISAKSSVLQQEEEEVAGQLTALESSETMQLAEKIALARGLVQEAQAGLNQQTTQLENARQTLAGVQTRQARAVQSWHTWQEANLRSLRELQRLAETEAHWDLARAQLAELAQQLGGLTLAGEKLSEPVGLLQALGGSESDERVEQLLKLETLHRDRETKELEVRVASGRAAERRAESDQARQYRDDTQQTLNEVRDQLANQWRELHRAEGWLATIPDYRLAQLVSSALRESLSDYRELTKEVLSGIVQAGRQLDQAFSRTLEEKGVYQNRLADLQAEYQRKQAESDRVPLRQPRRQAAREFLATKGIEAIPFYALVDFQPGLTPGQAGQIEAVLEEAGLLDALVIPAAKQQVAIELLIANKLSDTFLIPGTAQGTSLTDWLNFTPASLPQEYDAQEWQNTVNQILPALSLETPADGKILHWQHGLLAGQTSEIEPLGYIGLANRQQRRQAELAELENRLSQAQTELTKLEERSQHNRVEKHKLEIEQAQLADLARAATVETAEATWNRAETERQRAERLLNEAGEQERQGRQELNRVITQMLDESKLLPEAARDPRRIRGLVDATRRLQNEAKALAQNLSLGEERWQTYHETVANLVVARQTETLAMTLYTESLNRATRASAELAELEKLTESPDWQAQVDRLTHLRERQKRLPQELREIAVEQGQVEGRLGTILQTLEQARQDLTEATAHRQATETTFSLKLGFYPVASLIKARTLDGTGDTLKAASSVIREKDTDKLPLEEEVEADYNRMSGQLMTEFNRQRAFLAEYGPDLDDESRIVFVAEDAIEPPALLELLASQIELQKTLLDKEERILFENFLLQEMAEAIRQHITGAAEWVAGINKVLHNLPMVGERYSLDWKPLEAGEMAEGSGSHLARHYRLLARPVQELTPEESQLILDALRREIDNLRLRQKDEPGLNFMEALIQIFDYREWFRFGVFITPEGGSRQRLTDRNVGTRSGAEQLFALYVPLFAALAALYSSYAAPGSPRLLALDEAFDKASLTNTKKILQFLVLQDFQWIMTGPQVSGMGSGVPVSAEYQMLHEKGSNVATAVPFYWIKGESDGGS